MSNDTRMTMADLSALQVSFSQSRSMLNLCLFCWFGSFQPISQLECVCRDFFDDIVGDTEDYLYC